MGLLDGGIARIVNSALGSLLLPGTLRREGEISVTAYGDPSPGTAITYSFKGFYEDKSAAYRAAAGIPETDVFINIAGASCAVVPAPDDLLYFKSSWWRARRVTTDPADAIYIVQCFKVEAP